MRHLLWLSAGALGAIGVVGAVLLLGREQPATPDMRNGGLTVLPSGLRAELQEMIWNHPGQGLTYRFRFFADGFHETEDLEKVMTDLHHLCTHFVLDRLANTGPMPGQVVVSLADQPSDFGKFDPEITQVFEAFRIENNTCIWGAY